MRLPIIRLPYQDGEVYTLYAFGDFHAFSASCDMKALLSIRDKIADDPMALCLFMGDAAEFITESDPRWHSGGVDHTLVAPSDASRIGDVEVDFLGKFFKPIHRKCIGYHDGNHEKSINKHNSTCVSQRVCERAGIDLDLYTPGSALTKIIFRNPNGNSCSLVINSSHGAQAGKMDGAKLNSMKQAMAWFHCDLMLRGHSHALFASPAEWLEPNTTHTKLLAKRGYVAHTGSFLRTYEQDQDSYAEDKDYAPTTIGCPRFFLTPSREGCSIEVIT